MPIAPWVYERHLNPTSAEVETWRRQYPNAAEDDPHKAFIRSANVQEAHFFASRLRACIPGGARQQHTIWYATVLSMMTPVDRKDIRFLGTGTGWLSAMHIPTGIVVELPNAVRGEAGKLQLVALLEARPAKRKRPRPRR